MHGMKAVCQRQLASYLANPLGYVFILVFVFLVNCLIFLPKEFYIRNVADLSMLEGQMPWLLAVLLSAIGMNAWTQEREQGTEELLLTLPLTIWEAFLGKYLAVLIFFTCALVCSMSSVVMLWWLGNPDLGLLLANYCGWWLMGAAFAALSLAVSVLVSTQAISFVCSLVVCGVALFIGQIWDWGSAFDRGLFSLADVGMTLTAVCAGFALALLLLSSRRWRQQNRSQRRWQLLLLCSAVVLSINIAAMGKRWNWSLDMTVEGLSSLSEASAAIVDEIEAPIALTVVLSQDMPDELRIQSRSLTDMCTALQQRMGGRLELQIIRPDDPLTSLGQYVQDNYHVSPRQVRTETLAGTRAVSVFMGAFLQSGAASQRIPFFERGMSAEYELVRAIRAIQQTLLRQKKVIGVVSTEIELLEHYSALSQQMRPAWQLIDELRKQYEVREVNPNQPIDQQLDALVVPLPSGLTAAQLQHLHHFIWQGGPTLLLADPMPILVMEEMQRYDIALAPSLPRYDRYAEDGVSKEPKGNIQALYRSLGLEHANNKIAWAQFRPDASLPDLPPEFVWMNEASASFMESPVTRGLETMMCIYPGYVLKRDGSEMQVETLLRIGGDVQWGSNPFSDYFNTQGERYQFQTEVVREPRIDPGPPLAVSVRGAMPSAFAYEDVDVGARSGSDTRVIMVCDLDLAHDRFYTMARRMNQKDSSDFQKIWASIRNVQFIGNAIDVLAGEDELLALRGRRQRYRSLRRIDRLRQDLRQKKLADKQKLESAVREEIASIQEDFDKQKQSIASRSDIDAYSQRNQLALLQKEHVAYIRRFTESQNKKLAEVMRVAEIEEQRAIKSYQRTVSYAAVGFPSAILGLILIIVMSRRLARERSVIPASRLRGSS